MIDQLFLASFGLLAVWCLSRNRLSTRRYGYIFGLCSQPFWYWTTFNNGQWGLFILTGCYSVIYCRGFYLHWLCSANFDNDFLPD